MAVNSPPVFRDFLGTRQRAEVKQPEMSMTGSVRISHNGAGGEDGEVSTRACSVYSASYPLTGTTPMFLPNALDPTSDVWRHLKADVTAHHGSRNFSHKEFEHDDRKKDKVASRDLLRSSLQFNSESLESSRPSKISRFRGQDDATRGLGNKDPSSFSGDLDLLMEPPRALPSGPLWMQTSVFRTDLSKRVESLRPGVLNSVLPRERGDAASGGDLLPKENAIAIGDSLPQPPGDEGSRTGLQGKGIAHLLNICPTKLVAGDSSAPGAVPSQSKVPSRNATSGSALLSLHQNISPVTRQLTVFYGGQAHVFDDVSSDKADAIMSLAGSSGRSWSTTYAHQPSASNISAASEGLELDGQKPKKGDGSMKKQGTHILSSDIKSSLEGLARAGVGAQPGHHYRRQDQAAALPSAGSI